MRLALPRFRPFKTISDLEERLKYKNFAQRLIDNRSKFNIVVVDDQNFTPLESLRLLNFNIVHIRDVPSIDTLLKYQIILCDLIGVGTALNPTLQGAQIIIELKKSYPEKIVIAYTGGGRPDLVERSIPVSDDYLKKDASVEQWCDVLDKAIEHLANPAKVWQTMRHRLLDAGVTPYQLAALEDIFVRNTLSGKQVSIDVLSKEMESLKIPSTAKAIMEHIVVHVGFELARSYMSDAN